VRRGDVTGESSPPSLLLQALRSPGPTVTVELRLPPTGVGTEESLSQWVDLNRTLRRLSRDELFVFLTDNAVGSAEEESLAHVGSNVGEEADLRRIVPILTAKHTLDYCLMFASRAVSDGFDSLTVLGGDRSVGPPRCVPHANQLRKLIGQRLPALTLGGWFNPLKDASTQVGFLSDPEVCVDFALGQIVSHHSLDQVEVFLRTFRDSGLDIPLVFGVFYYRSANPRTLEILGDFFPVPAAEVTREFESGASPEEVCARTIRELRRMGVENVYVSNLGNQGTSRRLRSILELV